MRKVTALLLAAVLLFSVCGCSHGEKNGDTVQFYYLRSSDSYLYGASDGVVTFEDRDPSGHEEDFRYLLMLYLQGPLDELLESPFPAGCEVTELTRSGTEMAVTLNSNFTALRGMDLTLACVCLARTCFSLANVQRVQICAQSGDGQVQIQETIKIDSLLLEDGAISSDRGA